MYEVVLEYDITIIMTVVLNFITFLTSSNRLRNLENGGGFEFPKARNELNPTRRNPQRCG
jgi:hypothetical protein